MANQGRRVISSDFYIRNRNLSAWWRGAAHPGYGKWIGLTPILGALMACHPLPTVAPDSFFAQDEPCSMLSEMGISDPIGEARASFRDQAGGRFFAVFSQLGPLFFGVNDYSDPDLTDQELAILRGRKIIWVPEIDNFCEKSDQAIASFESYNLELIRLHSE